MKPHFLNFLIIQFLFCLIIPGSSCGQEYYKPISIGLNYARHGSGDMDGILLNLDYTHQLTKKVSLIYNLGFSLHSAKEIFFSSSDNQNLPDDQKTVAPLWVTAGLQLSPLITYNFGKSIISGFKISAGPVLRYQLNSYPNYYSYYTGNPSFRQSFYVIKQMDIYQLNIGYNLRLSKDFNIVNRHCGGVNLFYQNDDNGDLLVGFGVKYGYKFR